MTTRRELANAVRALSMDAVEAANSGHPGMPMGMADIAEVLWNDFLRHNPSHPKWFNRDRFLLSNGHGSMLQYSLLHLAGYDLPIHELKNFRQLHSRTAGHPEYSETPGVETTTGPLGQGLANAVGFALAEQVLAARFNKPGHTIVDHHTYVFMGDGCMMEGVSHEVASLAGTLKLGKLIAVYDDNGISIDGEVHDWFTDDTAARFKAYGWNVIADVDGHDADAVKKALTKATAQGDKPTLIVCRTIIGFGSPNKEGKESSHGAALGKDEVAAARKQLGWNYPPFEVPAEIYAAYDAREAGARREAEWNEAFNAYAKAFPELADELKRRISGTLPANWSEHSMAFVRKVQVEGATDRLAQGIAEHARCLRSAAAGTDRRLGGPRTVEPDHLEGFEASQPEQPGCQLHPLRRARVRHDGHRQWPGAAWRLHSLRRHLPGVLRLRTQCGAHVVPDPGPFDPRVHA